MSNLVKIRWSTGCRRCVVNDTSGVRTSCGECFPYCNTLLEKCSPNGFLFHIKTFKLVANFNKIWNIMFYAVFAAWSTKSYTITALTVVSFGRQLLNLNIVGGNKNKNTKQQQHQNKHKHTHKTQPTKQTPKKSEMDVSETVKCSKLPLSEPLSRGGPVLRSQE